MHFYSGPPMHILSGVDTMAGDRGRNAGPVRSTTGNRHLTSLLMHRTTWRGLKGGNRHADPQHQRLPVNGKTPFLDWRKSGCDTTVTLSTAYAPGGVEGHETAKSRLVPSGIKRHASLSEAPTASR